MVSASCLTMKTLNCSSRSVDARVLDRHLIGEWCGACCNGAIAFSDTNTDTLADAGTHVRADIRTDGNTFGSGGERGARTPAVVAGDGFSPE